MTKAQRINEERARQILRCRDEYAALTPEERTTYRRAIGTGSIVEGHAAAIAAARHLHPKELP